MASNPRLEGVAYTANRAYAGGFPIAVELLAQVGNIQIHHVRVDSRGATPYDVEQDRAREYLPGALEHGRQQSELFGRKLDPLSPTPDLVAERVERDVTGCKNRSVLLFSPGSPGEGPHAGQKLGESEGLGEVVVSAGVQTLYTVFDLVPGGQQ